MQASKDRGAPSFDDEVREESYVTARRELDDSWFRWQKPPTLPPAPPPREPQATLDDELADGWFV